MEFAFFYGPDKIPFDLDEKGIPVADTTIPFHGIISRGLLEKFVEAGLTSETWHKYAYLIDSPFIENMGSCFLQIREYARECYVLSFGHSASSTKLFIENYCKDLIIKDNARCEIWNIKEGHISSVWHVSIFEPNSKAHQFIINVARDQDAGIELKRTSSQMQIIAEHCPQINMAKVNDIRKIILNYYGAPLEVTVTKNDWIENSYEIHTIEDEVKTKQQYLLVERFLTQENKPSQIQSIYGRIFSKEEGNKIKEDIECFLSNASLCLSKRIKINVNNGDVVWNGEKAIVIAIS